MNIKTINNILNITKIKQTFIILLCILLFSSTAICANISGGIIGGSSGGTGSGDLLADGTIPLTANWDVGAFTITALRFVSDQPTGTAPFTVASTTVVTNLNADLLDGNSGSAYALLANAVHTGTFEVPEIKGTAKTSAPGSPVVGTKYLADAVTWDPLTRIKTDTASTYAFADANPDTITSSVGGLIVDGFASGMTLVVTGDSTNNGTYTINTVTDTVITLIASDSLSTEAQGDSVTLTGYTPYWVVYNPTGSYIGLDDYMGNFGVSSAAVPTTEINGSASVTLAASQLSGTIVYNTGMGAADVALTLDTAVAGLNALFTVGTAQSNKWGVRAGTNDKIYLIAADGTISAGADNGYARMTAAQVGQSFACWTFKTDAYDWQCKAISIGTSTFAAN